MKFYRLVLTSILLAASGSWPQQRQANIEAVNKLRTRLLESRFEEVYTETSSVLRSQLTREDFVESLRNATDILKALDPNLEWQRVDRSPEPAVYRDVNWPQFGARK